MTFYGTLIKPKEGVPGTSIDDNLDLQLVSEVVVGGEGNFYETETLTCGI